MRWSLSGIRTSCPRWTCSDNCSGAAACPAWPRWRRPGSPGSPRTAPSRGGGRWCRPPPAWRPPRTARSRQSGSTTRSGSSQSLKSCTAREGGGTQWARRSEQKRRVALDRLANRCKQKNWKQRMWGVVWVGGGGGGGGGKRSLSLLQTHHGKIVSFRITSQG